MTRKRTKLERLREKRQNFEKGTKIGACMNSVLIRICELDVHESRGRLHKET